MKILVVTHELPPNGTIHRAVELLPDVELLHAATLAEATAEIAHANNTPPAFDLCILDYQLPDLPGLKGVTQLASHLRGLPIALLIQGGSLEMAQRAHRVGANGVLSYELPPADLSNALKLTASGQFITVFSELIHVSKSAALNQLSEREIQVLRGLCDGLQNKEIAHVFAIQEVTVKMHMRSVVRKLGAKNRTHAAMIARDMYLI